MSWEVIVNGLKEFWAQPVPIIGFSVGTLIIGICTIISKTSFGKRLLNKLKGNVQELSTNVDTFKSDTNAKIEELKSYYEQAMALLEAKKDNTEKLLLAIAEQLHNVKIEELVKEYKANAQKSLVLDDIVKQKIGEVKEDYDALKSDFLKQQEEVNKLLEALKEYGHKEEESKI